MAFRVTWKTQDGEQGVRVFQTKEDADAAARAIRGVALVNREPAGSVTVFRDGQVLDGAEAMEATQEFTRDARE